MAARRRVANIQQIITATETAMQPRSSASGLWTFRLEAAAGFPFRDQKFSRFDYGLSRSKRGYPRRQRGYPRPVRGNPGYDSGGAELHDRSVCQAAPRITRGAARWDDPLSGRLGLDVVLQAHLVEQTELRFQPVHVLFLGGEDLAEQVAAHVIADRFAVGDGVLEIRQRDVLHLQVALEDLLDVLPDHQLAEILQIRQSLEEQDALDEPVGMLHLVDRFLVFLLAEFFQPPVLQDPRVQEILVDGGQFVLEDLVQVLDDLGIAFHALFSWAESFGVVALLDHGAAKQAMSRCDGRRLRERAGGVPGGVGRERGLVY